MTRTRKKRKKSQGRVIGSNCEGKLVYCVVILHVLYVYLSYDFILELSHLEHRGLRLPLQKASQQIAENRTNMSANRLVNNVIIDTVYINPKISTTGTAIALRVAGCQGME